MELFWIYPIGYFTPRSGLNNFLEGLTNVTVGVKFMVDWVIRPIVIEKQSHKTIK
jgi:hypothetical protein